MRNRLAAVLVSLVAAASAVACGGDGDDEASQPASDTSAAPLATDECQEIMASVMNAASAAFTGRAAELDKVAEAMERAGEDAPESVKRDLKTIGDALVEASRALEEAGIDVDDPSSMTPEKMKELEEFAEPFDNERYEEAARNVEEYFEEKCAPAR